MLPNKMVPIAKITEKVVLIKNIDDEAVILLITRRPSLTISGIASN